MRTQRVAKMIQKHKNKKGGTTRQQSTAQATVKLGPMRCSRKYTENYQVRPKRPLAGERQEVTEKRSRHAAHCANPLITTTDTHPIRLSQVLNDITAASTPILSSSTPAINIPSCSPQRICDVPLIPNKPLMVTSTVTAITKSSQQEIQLNTTTPYLSGFSAKIALCSPPSSSTPPTALVSSPSAATSSHRARGPIPLLSQGPYKKKRTMRDGHKNAIGAVTTSNVPPTPLTTPPPISPLLVVVSSSGVTRIADTSNDHSSALVTNKSNSNRHSNKRTRTATTKYGEWMASNEMALPPISKFCKTSQRIIDKFEDVLFDLSSSQSLPSNTPTLTSTTTNSPLFSSSLLSQSESAHVSSQLQSQSSSDCAQITRNESPAHRKSHPPS
jgi:hypothetical protein